MSRNDLILGHVDRQGIGLELGPSHSPIAPKRDGFNVHVLDYLDEQGLREKYAVHEEVDVSGIEEVDFVWNGESYAEITGRPNQYDWVIASHVVEHSPDLIGFLLDCDGVLKDSGCLSLAIPDKRFCFDQLRPLSGLGRVVDAHIEGRKVHSPGTAAEYFMSVISKDGLISWPREASGQAELIHTTEQARSAMESASGGKYLDMHGWCFTPWSFRLLIQDLHDLGYIPLKEVAFHDPGASEFFMTLSRDVQPDRLDRLSALTEIQRELAVAVQSPPVAAPVAPVAAEAAPPAARSMAPKTVAWGAARRLRSSAQRARRVASQLPSLVVEALPVPAGDSGVTSTPDMGSAESGESELQQEAIAVNILDEYVSSMPSDQNALDIFQGEWSSALPDERNLEAGPAALFEDSRLEWLFSQLGGVAGMNVLELGPLEAGHTYMLEQAGAASILSIEANTRSYLKCLIVKEILGLEKSRFQCGDFVEYLQVSDTTFDLAIASGVLYHMQNPAEVIALLSEASDKLFVWTHYYDESEVAKDPALSKKFPTSEVVDYRGFTHTLHKFEYQAALNWKGFCGGGAAHSNWMTRDDMLRCLKEFGFSTVEIAFDAPNHPNGPAFAFLATK